MFIKTVLLLLLITPVTARAYQCRDLLRTSTAPSHHKTLTQVYIHRNYQFPLHSNLIQIALAADIVLNHITADSPLDYTMAAHALNNLHRKYSVPVRVDIPGEPRTPGPWRLITLQDLRQTIDPILYDNFNALNDWDYLTPHPTERQILFWSTVRSFFDSTFIGYISAQYKQAISQPRSSGADIHHLKEQYHRVIMEEFYRHMQVHLPQGLNNDERLFLSSTRIL